MVASSGVMVLPYANVPGLQSPLRSTPPYSPDVTRGSGNENTAMIPLWSLA